MRTTIDKFGRVVVPKELRDELGIEPGTDLDVQIDDDGIVLRAVGQRHRIANKGGLLVVTGRVPRDLADVVKRDRERRLQTLGRGIGRPKASK